MKQYFYIDSNNQQVGPISEEALLVLVKNGIVSSLANVWTEGLADWLPFSELFPEEIATVLPPSPSMAPGNDAFPKTIDEIQHGEGASSGQNADAKNKSKPSMRLKLRAGKLFIDSPEEKQEPSFLMDQLRKIIKLAAICGVVYGGYYVYTNYLGGEDSDIADVLGSDTKPKRSRISKKEAVEELRKLGVISSELDIQGRVGRRAMEDACEQGNEEILELLVAGGANAKQIDETNLLSKSAEKGFTKIVSNMLTIPGIDVNDGNALWHAAENGHVKIVKLLLAHPDIKIDSNSFYSPLRGAVEKGHIRVVKLLLAHHGIYVNEYYKDIHATPLSLAAAGGHVEIVKLLLAQPDIDVKLGDVLAAAARGGNMEIVNLLLAQSGISVKESNALESAANGGHAEIVKLLLAQPGVDVETFSEINLGVAVENGYTEVVKLLLPKPGIKVNEEKSSSNYSLLYVASDKGYTEIVKLLLAVPGIDVNRGNPLRQAAEKGHTKIVKLLLTHPEVEVNTEHSYSSPMYVAAREGHTEIVKLLLSHPDVEGDADSLICAAKSGYTEIVMMLLNSPEIEKNISFVNYRLGIEMGYYPNNVGLKRLRSLLENKKNRK